MKGIDGTITVPLAMFKSDIAGLMGILASGFYLHNISLSIYQNGEKPENAKRDMCIAFSAVCLCYIVCGTLGAIGFSNKALFPNSNGVKDNCLNMFDATYVPASIVRVTSFL